MKDLVLHLKYIWWDKIKSGEKTEEYRETKPYWDRRLKGKTFDRVILVRGNYGEEKNPEKCMTFPWNGYEIKWVGSWERQEMVRVYAIKLVKGGPDVA